MDNFVDDLGDKMHFLARRLWPINRSITGDGVRVTLRIIQEYLSGLNIHEVESGTKVFDWVVPQEWKIREAWIATPDNKKICQFSENNLHIVGYSIPVDIKLPLSALQAHLYSLPELPDAIPYVTSYYARRWGFCLSDRERKALPEGEYYVHIDSELFNGHLTYGELLIKGDTEQEVLISTYVCHPSMANNELSGPVVTTFLAVWLLSQPRLRYSYRIVFVPETIGSITYLSRNLKHLQKQVVAGFNVTCVGDERSYSYLPSRKGDTLSDNVAKHVLKHIDRNFLIYRWEQRGSDERQYCAPFVDLPIASIMRTKYGAYMEYHTSLDDLVHVVTPLGLSGGYRAIRNALEVIERNRTIEVLVLCEPQLGRRGLYPTLSTRNSAQAARLMMNLITWADGTMTLLDIAERLEVPIWDLYEIVDSLLENDIIRFSD